MIQHYRSNLKLNLSTTYRTVIMERFYLMCYGMPLRWLYEGKLFSRLSVRKKTKQNILQELQEYINKQRTVKNVAHIDPSQFSMQIINCILKFKQKDQKPFYQDLIEKQNECSLSQPGQREDLRLCKLAILISSATQLWFQGEIY